MTDNMFDNFVRNKLKDHQSPVPNGLWEKIERKRETEPKGGFWLSKTSLWIAALFLLLGSGAAYVFWPASNNDETASLGNKTKTANNLDNNDQTIQPRGTGNRALTKIEDVTDQNKTIDNGEMTESGSTKTNSPVGNDFASVRAINENNVNSKDHKGVTTNRFTATNPRLSSGSFASKEKKQNVFSEGAITPNTIVTSEEMNNYEAFALGKTAIRNLDLSALRTNERDLSAFKVFGVDCPPGTLGRNDWYVELYGSPDIAFKSVKSNGLNSSYLQKKDSTETQQIGYTAGFRISKSIGENLLLKSGIQFSQINERFDLRTENERRIVTVVTIRTISDANGNPVQVRDTTTFEQIGYRVRRTYNKYRSIDIPLLLSYEFGKENFRMGVNAGVIFNLRSWYDGETLNDTLAVVSLSSKQNSMYKQNIGLGLYAGFSFIKPVTNRLDLFAEPYFRYNLSSMTKNTGYIQRFNGAGLSLGIRYRINGAAKK